MKKKLTIYKTFIFHTTAKLSSGFSVLNIFTSSNVRRRNKRRSEYMNEQKTSYAIDLMVFLVLGYHHSYLASGRNIKINLMSPKIAKESFE